MRVLRLTDVRVTRASIVGRAELDELPFQVTVWYRDLDLHALEARIGTAGMTRLAFHVVMFQLNAVASLRPDRLELGRWADLATPAFVSLWTTVFRNVWAQWRWEHEAPDYHGPAFVDAPTVAGAAEPIALVPGPIDWLVFCGGGKDSLVALKLFERAGLPFATLGYAHSIYGEPVHQHALLERVASTSTRARAEQQWVFDDFLTSPVVELCPELGVRSLLAAETPASVFAAVPLALARGYRGLVVAHERGANVGNLTWTATGEEVNHQWGKGWAAERLLDQYVQEELVAGLRYFSVLQPVHDEVILELLAADAELAPRTHSCNLAKPWCGACAKCVYVWLQMSAHLPADVVARTFTADLGERAGNRGWLRQLLGLEAHTPFECVGSIAESRLALALLARRRALGPQLAALASEVGPVDVVATAAPLLEVGDEHGMPPEVAARVLPQLRAAAAAASRRVAGG